MYCLMEQSVNKLKSFQILRPIVCSCIIVLCLLMIAQAQAMEKIAGKVVGIADGDTITVLQDNKQYRIRLYGIDTPEKRQDFGQRAKQFTSKMVFRKPVEVRPLDIDRYKRIVGLVYVKDQCLNKELVKAGFAWVYQKYCKKSFCNNWLKLEQAARTNKLGLWVYDNPIPPWDFRHGKKHKRNANYSGPYHGNVNSHVFHAPWCKHFDCKNCTKVFQDKNIAISKGYRPCGICKP